MPNGIPDKPAQKSTLPVYDEETVHEIADRIIDRVSTYRDTAKHQLFLTAKRAKLDKDDEVKVNITLVQDGASWNTLWYLVEACSSRAMMRSGKVKIVQARSDAKTSVAVCIRKDQLHLKTMLWKELLLLCLALLLSRVLLSPLLLNSQAAAAMCSRWYPNL